ncbi:MAG TPA: hypothetical protein DCE41_03230 [Cytophagales bacterium]|nr:hypothetical protein [Cytophagales bacterium]HAA23422.1 hypothetical protein [Cytophagales bacterium]HAP58617.1 hypothetical protein [Cytophagales bacterium]
MEKSQVDEVLAVLGTGAKPWNYYQDQFIMHHLARLVKEEPMTVKRFKQSRYSGWLRKQILQEFLAKQLQGLITTESILMSPQVPQLFLTYSLGKWGGMGVLNRSHFQTTRVGFNLVLQVNLCKGLVNTFKRYVSKKAEMPKFWGHPVSDVHATLGWVRLDFDLGTDSILIEEIQSDLVRQLPKMMQRMKPRNPKGDETVSNGIRKFLRREFEPYNRMWSEALLACALQFIDQELGFRQVYMHTWESGCVLKGISQRHGPPRSLYTQLPKKFGFVKQDKPPVHLYNHHQLLNRREELQISEAKWWKLEW